MATVRILNCERKLPEAWNECTPGQLENAMAAFNEGLDDQDLLIRLFLALWIRDKKDIEAQQAFWGFMKKLERAKKIKDREQREQEVATLSEDLMSLCRHTTKFFLEEADGLTKNPYPTLRAGRKHLIGPANDLADLRGGEFAVAEKHLQDWVNDQKESALDLLVATLWRPARKDYDPMRDTDQRARFVITQPDILCRWTRKLSLEKKLVCLQFYRSCREEIVKNNPHVFNDESEEQAQEGAGWLDVFMELGDGTRGYNEIADEHLSIIMYDLKRLQRKHRKGKKALTQNQD